MLGGRLAARLGVIKGDVLRLIVNLAKHPVNESMLIPDLANFVVVGFYESELAVYDNNFGFIQLEAAQKMYNKKNQSQHDLRSVNRCGISTSDLPDRLRIRFSSPS